MSSRTCRCDIDAFGNCLPCEEQKKTAPPAKEGSDVPQVFCPCDVGAGGKCLPCQEDKDEKGGLQPTD